MEQVLRLLEGFIHRPPGAATAVTPGFADKGEAAAEEPAASREPGVAPWE